MPKFSVFIPILGDSIELERTIASLLRGCNLQTQVIAVHDGTYRDEYDLQSEGVEFVALPNHRRLISFWNAALSRASGDYLLVVRPGVELDDHWQARIAKSFFDPNVALVAPVIESAGQSIVGINVNASGTRSLATRVRDFGLGGTSYAVAFRNEALGWLPTLDNGIEDLYLDAEIAMGLRELGYQSHLATDWIVGGPIDEIHREATQPHGCSASRSLNRHRDLFTTPNTMILREVLQSIWQGPKTLRHAWQRLAAKKFARDDQRAFQQLQQAKQSLAELSANRTEPPQRRAA